jgi:uncharacterized protein
VTLPYNLAMLLVDVAAIWLVRRRTGLLFWCGVMAAAGVFATALAGILGGCLEDHFGFFRLWAYAVFLHGPLLLGATTVLWRRSRPRLAIAAVLGIVALLAIAADAFLIEPYWLEIVRYRIASPKIHHPLRIVVVADLQTDHLGPYERAALHQVLEEKPDLILLAGDYLQIAWNKQQQLRQELRDYLREIHFTAPGGVFAIGGNADPDDWREIFTGLDFTLVDTWRSFALGDLQLTCLGLAASRDTTAKLKGAPPDRFHLVVGHQPDFALGQIEADLLVAGHTHGGQVRLPGAGPIITHSRIPHRWAAGLTQLPSGAQLLVSRGIGMERSYAPRMRFLCRPELTVIDLVPESTAPHSAAHQ